MLTRNSRVIALLQLLRLPNVFTALADVAMGFLVTHGTRQATGTSAGLFAILAAASCLLYQAGMVLNDVFDVEADSRERPDRPIPSGRVPLPAAAALAWAMLASGVLFGWLAGFLASDWRPGIVATLLAACVVLYDWTLKRTPAAPFFMGACRMLNVLLGMSLARADISGPADRLVTSVTSSPRPWIAAEWLIATGIGVYILGVTLFARTEARASSRLRLATGTLVMAAGMALLASLPAWLKDGGLLTLKIAPTGWYLLWGVIALLILGRCAAAVLQPIPPRVQVAVRNGVQSIIVLDAAVCAGFVHPYWGMFVLVLMVPTALLTQWLKAT